MADRYLGIDIGAESLKVAEMSRTAAGLVWTRRRVVEHAKELAAPLAELLVEFDWRGVAGAAVTGRLSRAVNLPRIPGQQAQAAGARFLHGAEPATLVSIGSRGFSVLELRDGDVQVFRQNSRCAQGTGNFLRQLVERFGLSVEEASLLGADVDDPAPLSGRCPVILKTDMTHLANRGEDRARILAGLFDAVCENVQALVKPHTSPHRMFLLGGVSRSPRVQANFARFCSQRGLVLEACGDDGLYYEALGAAATAAEAPPVALPEIHELVAHAPHAKLSFGPPLAEHLPHVTRLERAPFSPGNGAGPLVLGFDIGSTGSKIVAADSVTREVVWEGYRNTNGDPVGAAQDLAQRFLEGPAGGRPVRACGVTGSGREIVGSLLQICFGAGSTFVLNEIAAHARGALHHDPRVDTIFEIGGQDAKYIRLAGGRVVDAAMNEACSAGTGSFIEEQGRRFAGIENVVQLGRAALAAPAVVSLGQHCSVFMAEVIDEAVADGVEVDAIIAGIYDSVVQNYLNRVKGARSVGDVVFCQGMPFSAPALAAAVARQTGRPVIVPPNPGTVGALGIALLALDELPARDVGLHLTRFREARVDSKDTFICRSTQGCGGAGNRCRIDRLHTSLDGEETTFTWGGACSLHDHGAGKRKLPDRAPDPFRRREEMIQEIVQRTAAPRGGRRIALTDEFVLKDLFPFFVTFLHELGLDPVVRGSADQTALKRGVETANVPFCAPMQLHHGLIAEMTAAGPELLFLPMLRGLPGDGRENASVCCPITQAAPDLVRWDLGAAAPGVVSPVIDFGPEGLDSAAFRDSCRKLAGSLRASRGWRQAFGKALAAQRAFDRRCLESGREALAFCIANGIVPVVVLGRTYTIHNTVLNSNVPALLREQGALPIPVDCYPLTDNVPVFQKIYWGHGQRSLRTAHQVRREDGVYSLFCSNYSCGPDSFNIHFASRIMDGKPFAIIETDGHSGDAGTKTRIEAFLHCVRSDLAGRASPAPAFVFTDLEQVGALLPDLRVSGETVLVPRLSEAALAATACLRGLGVDAECLPPPDAEALRLGRQCTSGKECLPLCLTLGSILQRFAREEDPRRRFVVTMPTTDGPCRFGVYHVLQQLILGRLGFQDRVRFWSPPSDDYFVGCPRGFTALMFSGIMAVELLTHALHDAKASRAEPDEAQAIYSRHVAELLHLLEREAGGELSVRRVMREVLGGRLFGCAGVLTRGVAELAATRRQVAAPTVLLVGEIYVRCDPFSSGFVMDQLNDRGVAVRMAPPSEWLEYVSDLGAQAGGGFAKRFSRFIEQRIREQTYAIAARALGWPPRTAAAEAVAAASGYIRPDLEGEAVLTLGGALHEWRHGLIDGAVSVGPLECMPNKIAEAQLFHAAEQEGLVSLTLSLSGEPVDPEVLDRFAFEVRARARRRQGRAATPEKLSP